MITRYISVHLIINPTHTPTVHQRYGRTDRRTTYDSNTVHRAVKIIKNVLLVFNCAQGQRSEFSMMLLPWSTVFELVPQQTTVTWQCHAQTLCFLLCPWTQTPIIDSRSRASHSVPLPPILQLDYLKQRFPTFISFPIWCRPKVAVSPSYNHLIFASFSQLGEWGASWATPVGRGGAPAENEFGAC